MWSDDQNFPLSDDQEDTFPHWSNNNQKEQEENEEEIIYMFPLECSPLSGFTYKGLLLLHWVDLI